jgi:hypothetical protein
MRIILPWNEEWFVVNIGKTFSQWCISDEENFADERGMVCRKYRNDEFAVPYC